MGVRTGAGHLEGVGVGAVEGAAADAGGGALVGGAAVDGAGHAQLVALGGLEEAGGAPWGDTEETGEETGEEG